MLNALRTLVPMLLASFFVLICSGSVVAGFIVRDVRSSAPVNNLAVADQLLFQGINVLSEVTVTRQFLDMADADNPTVGGHYFNNQSFPNNLVGADDDNFAVHATAMIVIPTAGIYTFGVNSDDGSRLRIDDGSGFKNVIIDDSTHGERDTLGQITFSQSGLFSLDFVFFEAGGQASVELFAAKGSFNSFDSDHFRLVGDEAGGGLGTFSSVPEPSSVVLLGIASLVFAGRRGWRKKVNNASDSKRV